MPTSHVGRPARRAQGHCHAHGPAAAALGTAPVLAFAIGMVWLSRHERMLRLVAAGQRRAL
jgi:hypothetical protein